MHPSPISAFPCTAYAYVTDCVTVLLIALKVRNPHTSTDDCLRDFCDGEDFKSHELFGHDPHALVLHCYYDDFQVTNPLGSKTKKHKIGKEVEIIKNDKSEYMYMYVAWVDSSIGA